MPFVDVEQLSVEWLQMRIAVVTASHMANLMAKRKDKKEAAPRAKYRKELVIENLTNRTATTYVSPSMEWGIETEPLARAAYEEAKGVEVLPGGFFLHDEIPRYGASPDGRVGNDGLIEIKCLESHNHLDVLMTGEIPEEYQLQMLAQMACSGRQWVDFVAYDPRLPEQFQLFVKRFPRDEQRIAAMNQEVLQFHTEVIELIKALEARNADTNP